MSKNRNKYPRDAVDPALPETHLPMVPHRESHDVAPDDPEDPIDDDELFPVAEIRPAIADDPAVESRAADKIEEILNVPADYDAVVDAIDDLGLTHRGLMYKFDFAERTVTFVFANRMDCCTLNQPIPTILKCAAAVIAG